MNKDDDEPDKSEEPEKRGLSWAAMVIFLILTMVAALVLAYLITKHNFPAH